MNFAYHKRRDPKIRVFLSQLPAAEIKEAMSYYGDIVEVNPVTKVIQGRKIDIELLFLRD